MFGMYPIDYGLAVILEVSRGIDRASGQVKLGEKGRGTQLHTLFIHLLLSQIMNHGWEITLFHLVQAL